MSVFCFKTKKNERGLGGKSYLVVVDILENDGDLVAGDHFMCLIERLGNLDLGQLMGTIL